MEAAGRPMGLRGLLSSAYARLGGPKLQGERRPLS